MDENKEPDVPLMDNHISSNGHQHIELMIGLDNILNANRQLHRYLKAQRVKFIRDMSFQKGTYIRDMDPNFQKFEKFRIMVTVFPPTRAHIDPPNLYPTVKALIDGFTDAEFWEDDNFRHLAEVGFRYGGLSGEKRTYKMVMDIQEIPETELNQYIMDV